LYYCINSDEEYQLNVIEKIKKLSYKIKLWSQRLLTMEGKTLIVKTFGLSQIIYNMQSYGFKSAELNVTEEESICKSAQETLNIIIDYNRETYQSMLQDEFETDKNLIDEVSSINLKNYLTRKNKVFMVCMIKPLTRMELQHLVNLFRHMNMKLMKS
jgi:hypothetical protein